MDKSVEEFQEELDLLKNEIRETLADVRQHLPTGASTPPSPGSPTSFQQPPPPGLVQSDALAPGAVGDAPQQPAAQSPSDSPDVTGPHTRAQASEEAFQPHAGQVLQEQEDVVGGKPTDESAADGKAAKAPKATPRKRASRPADAQRQASGQGQGKGRSKARAKPKVSATSSERVAGRRAPGPAAGSPEWQRGYGYPPQQGNGEKLTLFSIATLMPFLEQGLRRIGPRRMKSILEVYARLGGMSTEMRDVLVQLVELDDMEPRRKNVSMRDSVRVLVELDNLLWQGRLDWQRGALQSMFLDIKTSQVEDWLAESEAEEE